MQFGVNSGPTRPGSFNFAISLSLKAEGLDKTILEIELCGNLGSAVVKASLEWCGRLRD
jgi:hypothetical protein